MTDPTNTTPSRTRSDDRRTIVVATLVVLAIGGLIAGAMMLVLTRNDGTAADCSGKRVVGDYAGLEEQARLSPFNGTLGGHCEYWIVLHDGKLLAAKAEFPGRDCKLEWYSPVNAFRCDKEPVSFDELAYWPATKLTDGQYEGAFEIDFGPAQP